jgi:hypothetical protein
MNEGERRKKLTNHQHHKENKRVDYRWPKERELISDDGDEQYEGIEISFDLRNINMQIKVVVRSRWEEAKSQKSIRCIGGKI